MAKKKKQTGGNTIALHKRARHDYLIEERFEAGLVLEGWEVKACRENRVNLSESYVLLKHGQAWLIGAHMTPPKSTSTHKPAEPVRTRKLLLHRSQINKLVGKVQRQGYTVVPLALYWKNGLVKLEIALAKGKKLHDKRATEKERVWKREQERTMKSANKG